jgi:hypothetical protein
MLAMQAAPGMGMYGQSYLARNMSMTELADAANGGGGDVNEVFKALGGNKSMAGDFFRGHTKSLLEGVTTEGLGDSNAGKIAKSLGSSRMDPREFFKKKLWKQALGKGATEQDALAGYAGALKASDENLDAGTAMGLARDITGIGGRAHRGGAAGAPGGGSQEMELAKEHLKALTTQVQAATTAFNEVVQAAKNLALRAKLESEGVSMQGGDATTQLVREKVLNYLPANATAQQFHDATAKEFALLDKAKRASQGAPVGRANVVWTPGGAKVGSTSPQAGLK